MIDSIGLSEAWDILYWAIILAISLMLIQRYGESTRGGRFWILIPILVLLVGFSIHVFSIGTAIGTGLEHPLLVIAYIFGGAFTISAADRTIKAVDLLVKRMLSEKKNE